ncbi:tyrosine-protein kinase STK-like [Sycon ciliatum]|uniref:tyrosine-protein kinase STK-like n=1 Tax=Sycon ciliatum TaxID=27933 RepID=UPI0020AE5AA8|eukprot:scpid84208/ scgid8108/ Tyrosine-protein kinase STK; P57-STK
MGNKCSGSAKKKPVNGQNDGPSLENQMYFFPDMSKVQAEEHLGQCEGRGTFLVRRSQTIAGEFSISVRNDEMVKHYRIQQHAVPPYKYFLSQQAYFDTLPELINFYQENTGTGGLRLTTPAPRTVAGHPNSYV